LPTLKFFGLHYLKNRYHKITPPPPSFANERRSDSSKLMNPNALYVIECELIVKSERPIDESERLFVEIFGKSYTAYHRIVLILYPFLNRNFIMKTLLIVIIIFLVEVFLHPKFAEAQLDTTANRNSENTEPAFIPISASDSTNRRKIQFSEYRNIAAELYKLNSTDKKSLALSNELHKAFVQIEKSQFDSIETICKSIVSRYEEIISNDSLAASHYLALCGGVEIFKARYDSALALYQRSLDRLPHSASPKTAASRYVLMAEAYNYLESPKAHFPIDSAISIYTILNDTINLAKSYLTKCLTYYRQKDYPNVTNYADKAEILLKQAEIAEHPLYIWVNYHRGFVQLDYQNYKLADDFFRKALAITQQYYEYYHINTAIMHNMCGITARWLKQPVEELFHHSDALKIRAKVYGADHFITSISYINLGNYYNDSNVIDSALLYYKRANDIRRKIVGEKHTKTYNSYYRINQLYYKQEKYDKALEYAHKAMASMHPTFTDTIDYMSLPVIGNNDYPIELTFSLERKVLCLYTMFMENHNKQYLDGMIEIIEKIDSVHINKKKALVAANYDSNILFHRSSQFLMGFFAAYHLFTEFNDSKGVDYMLKYTERSRANNLLETTNLYNMQNNKDIQKLLKLESEKFNLEKFYRTSDNETQNLITKEKIIAYSDSIEQQVLYIREKYPELPVFSYNLPTLTINQVQEKLSPETAIIEYVTFDTRHLFLLYIDKEVAKIIWKNIPKMNSEIDKLLLLIRNPEIDSKNEIFTLGRSFYELFLTDISNVNFIEKSIKNLVIIPQGSIWKLPFELLLTDSVTDKTTFSNAPYLLKKYTISYSPSLKYYFREREATPTRNTKVLAVAPVFDTFSTNSPTRTIGGLFPSDTTETESLRSLIYRDNTIVSLPYTRNEVNDIATFYKETVLLTETDANKKKLESLDLMDFKIIHIASHAISNYSDADFSGIVLAAADSLSDNVLFGGELINYKLNTDLLILSACETSAGKILLGEGVNSLSNTFGSIGANNVIASLWKVSDYETWLLMSHFHKLNAKSKTNDYAQTLRKAKLKMLNNLNTAHPFYWSAFTLTHY